MNVFELAARISLDTSRFEENLNNAKGIAEKFGSAIKGGFQTVAKVGAAGIAATSGVVALSKSALDSYASYEQLVGGVETLFKESADKVQEYADNAYKTAGMSANEYMETVTSFSASLLQSLGGDTDKAADTADMAIRDMADNANKMGTSMESIQNAYQGFAKQNYTMLDNLKLGYGGTKSEMQRLLADAQAISGIEYNLESYADIVEAIHVIQTEMGITGTTAREAASTIEGSVNTMKSAWSNLVVEIAKDNGDIDGSIDQFIDSVVTVGNNIMPRVRKILDGIGKLVNKMLPVIVKGIPKIVAEYLPQMLETGTELSQALLQGITDNLPDLITAAIQIVETVGKGILQMLPTLGNAALKIILTLADFLTENLPTMIPEIVGIVLEIVDTLTNPDTLGTLIDAAIAIIMALVDGLLSPDTLDKLITEMPVIVQNIVDGIVENVPKLLEAAVAIIKKIVEYLSNFENVRKLIDAGAEILASVITGIGSLITSLGYKMEEVVKKIVDTLGWGDYWQAGMDVINDFMGGIKEAWNNWADFWEGFGEYLYDSLHGSADWEDYAYTATTGDFDVPEYATGGIVRKPTLAVVGEAGPEAIVPLANNTQWIDSLAGRVGNAVNGAGMTVQNLNINMEGMSISSDYDTDRFVERISEKLEVLSRREYSGIGGTNLR